MQILPPRLGGGGQAWGSWHGGSAVGWGSWDRLEDWSINKHSTAASSSRPPLPSCLLTSLNEENCWSFFPGILFLSGKNNIDNWQYWRAGFIFIKLHYRLYWFIVTFLTEFYCRNIHCRTLFQFKMLMEDSFVHKKNWHLKETVTGIFYKLINNICNIKKI